MAVSLPNRGHEGLPRLLFTKTLGKTDIRHRLAFPTKWRNLFFDRSYQGDTRVAKMDVWDVLGQKVREFVCRIRKGTYAKPVLSGSGWSGFVKENKLEVGDKILFFEEALVDDHGARFRISVERATSNITSATRENSLIGTDAIDTTLRLSIN